MVWCWFLVERYRAAASCSDQTNMVWCRYASNDAGTTGIMWRWGVEVVFWYWNGMALGDIILEWNDAGPGQSGMVPLFVLHYVM